MLFIDLSPNRLVFNKSKAPQYYGTYMVPGRNFTALPPDAVKTMQTCRIPIIIEDDPEFPNLFKRSTGNGILLD